MRKLLTTILKTRKLFMEKQDIKAAMTAIVKAHRLIDEAGPRLKGTRLERHWQELWNAMDILQAELIQEKVRLGMTPIPTLPEGMDDESRALRRAYRKR